MSKSKGNVMYSDDLTRYFGVDAVRHYVLHEMPYAQDGTITWELMIERINSDLANILGNLVNRTISMANKYFDGVIHNRKVTDQTDDELIQLASVTAERYSKLMDSLHISDAIDEVFTLLRRSNKYIDETTPWVLAKDETSKDRLETVLYHLLDCIRISAVLLEPFMPETSKKILDQLQTRERDYDSVTAFGNLEDGIEVIEKPSILFERMDLAETLEKIKSEMGGSKVKVTAKPVISFEDFSKIQLQVGTVLKCEKHPKADRLLVSQVDIGSKTLQIVSGIADHVKPEDFVGRKIVVVTNLAPAKLRGVESQGMILAGEHEGILEVVGVDQLEDGVEIS